MEQEVRIEALMLHEARRLALFRAPMIYLLAANARGKISLSLIGTLSHRMGDVKDEPS